MLFPPIMLSHALTFAWALRGGVSLQENPVAVAVGLVVVSSLALIFFTRRGRGGRRGPVALDGATTLALALVEKQEISPDTRRFRFALPTPAHVLGLPIGQHMSLSYTDAEGKSVSRAYTPVTSDDELGYVDFVVKVYFANVHPKFPEGGKMSQHLNNMAIGETIDVRGPKGKLTYHGRGRFEIKERPNDAAGVQHRAKNVGMIAGGSGITPMLQIIRAMIKDAEDTTRVWLLFANQTEADILLRPELEAIAETHKARFTLWYTLDRPAEGWRFSSGFISQPMLAEHMPPCSPDTLILMCGPPAMINMACVPNLDALGYAKDKQFAF